MLQKSRIEQIFLAENQFLNCAADLLKCVLKNSTLEVLDLKRNFIDVRDYLKIMDKLAKNKNSKHLKEIPSLKVERTHIIKQKRIFKTQT